MVSIVVAIIALVVAGLLIGVIAAAVKTGQAEGGNSVIKNVYIYLVLFATLMMTIGGSVAAFMAVADIVYPTPTISPSKNINSLISRGTLMLIIWKNFRDRAESPL